MDGTAHDRSADQAESIDYLIATPGAAIAVDWSFERYLADKQFVSRSALEDLRQRGPAYFRAKYIDRGIGNRSTPAMALGTMVHTKLLEPETWDRKLFIWDELPRPPGANGKAKKGSPEKDAYVIWKANESEWNAKRDQAIADGLTVIDWETADKVIRMADSVASHPFGQEMFEPGTGVNETTILWHHPGTGVLIRVRLDRMVPIDDNTVSIVDLKTTMDPSPTSFGKSIVKYGYHTQGALYTDAVSALYPGVEFHYIIAAVRNEPPHEAAFYELPPSAMDLGRDRYNKALAELVRCRETNDWSAEWQQGCADINLPGWAFYED
jgi:hypothetical protein